jgi:hypothetical protein
MNACYVILGILVFWTLLAAVLARWEKRMVWPYGEPQKSPPHPDTTGYGVRTANAARAAGFHFFGWSPDLKGPRYKVSYGFLLSPEGNQLAIVSSGTIMNIKLAAAKAKAQAIRCVNNGKQLGLGTLGTADSGFEQRMVLSAVFSAQKTRQASQLCEASLAAFNSACTSANSFP